jgi:hypothetical protein
MFIESIESPNRDNEKLKYKNISKNVKVSMNEH